MCQLFKIISGFFYTLEEFISEYTRIYYEDKINIETDISTSGVFSSWVGKEKEDFIIDIYPEFHLSDNESDIEEGETKEKTNFFENRTDNKIEHRIDIIEDTNTSDYVFADFSDEENLP